LISPANRSSSSSSACDHYEERIESESDGDQSPVYVRQRLSEDGYDAEEKEENMLHLEAEDSGERLIHVDTMTDVEMALVSQAMDMLTPIVQGATGGNATPRSVATALVHDIVNRFQLNDGDCVAPIAASSDHDNSTLLPPDNKCSKLSSSGSKPTTDAVGAAGDCCRSSSGSKPTTDAVGAAGDCCRSSSGSKPTTDAVGAAGDCCRVSYGWSRMIIQ